MGINKVLIKLSYILRSKRKKIHRATLSPDMFETEFRELYKLCSPYTMTSCERMYGLYKAVDYVLSSGVPGDFVECGVWRGGSAMIIAKMMVNRGVENRKIYMYDTYEGMSPPTNFDIDINGQNASELMAISANKKEMSVWCLADLSEVKQNLASTGLAPEQLIFIKGKVEETIPEIVPEHKIAILRLDTDWYESTKHELLHLYPILSVNGVLIIDDYGHWSGCRKAVDEYFNSHNVKILMNRIDYTGRIGIKTS